MPEPDYIVFRAYPGAPPGWLPSCWDGQWMDRSKMPGLPPPGESRPQAVAVPTGEFEVRDDLAVAEVWEVRPYDGD